MFGVTKTTIMRPTSKALNVTEMRIDFHTSQKVRNSSFSTKLCRPCQRNEYCQNDKCSIISPHSVKNSNMTRRLRGFRNKTHALSSISQVDLYSFPGAFSHFIYSSTFVFWNLSNKFFFLLNEITVTVPFIPITLPNTMRI